MKYKLNVLPYEQVTVGPFVKHPRLLPVLDGDPKTTAEREREV